MRRKFNKRQGTRFHWQGRIGCMAAGLVILTAAAAWGQLPTLAVGNSAPIQDAIGRPFKGVAGRPDISARVEIRQIASGAIVPANQEQGLIDVNNPLMTNACIGQGVIEADSGMFSISFMESELNHLHTYYVRVFDWTTPAESLYYIDSVPFAGMASGTINPEFGVLKLVSTGEEDVDTDGDGIPDAMEIDMGLDPNTADTDGDGYSDYFEVLYPDYLDPNDEGDPRLVLYIHPPVLMESDPYTVSWETIPVPGMEYILEYTDALPYEDLFTATVTNVIATDTNLVVPVDEWIQLDDIFKGFFRVTIPYSMP